MSEKNYIERYWRDAKPEDAIKEPPMVARFEGTEIIGNLRGFKLVGNLKWCDNESMWWSQCQVYDAPDPGEGYELIDTRKARKQEGDEVLGDDGKWSLADPYNFVPELHYRRRITPTATYVPFTWEDREQLRGRWIKFKNGREVQCTKLEPMNHGGGMVINCYTPLELLQNATFLDTGKPVGKEVTQ